MNELILYSLTIGLFILASVFDTKAEEAEATPASTAGASITEQSTTKVELEETKKEVKEIAEQITALKQQEAELQQQAKVENARIVELAKIAEKEAAGIKTAEIKNIQENITGIKRDFVSMETENKRTEDALKAENKKNEDALKAENKKQKDELTKEINELEKQKKKIEKELNDLKVKKNPSDAVITTTSKSAEHSTSPSTMHAAGKAPVKHK